MENLIQEINDGIQLYAENFLSSDGVDELATLAAAEEIASHFQLKSWPYPQKPGLYWFYGDPFINDVYWEERHVNVLYLVEAYSARSSGDKVYYKVRNGGYFNNHRPGLWARAIVPLLPSEEEELK